VGAFCRLKDHMCDQFKPETMCATRRGTEFGPGPAHSRRAHRPDQVV
jgi:hypothetical protein